MRVRWSSKARGDLLALYLFTAADNRGAARRLVARVRAACVSAGEVPWAGRVVPEFEVAELRERIVSPYRVVYLVREEAVVIVRIWHTRRDLAAADAAGRSVTR